MADSDALLDALERFAETLLTESYGVTDVLHMLTEQVATVVGVTGAGVILERRGRYVYVTSLVDAIADLERIVEEQQSGPCVDAAKERRCVMVHDLTVGDSARRWPGYAEQARRSGIRAAAAVPLRAGGRVIGAMNIYHETPRAWTSEDVRVATILADIASTYVVHASELDLQRRIAEQLQQALDSRIVIEQAKGILAVERGISVDDSFVVLRKYARDHNARLHDVCAAVVTPHRRRSTA